VRQPVSASFSQKFYRKTKWRIFSPMSFHWPIRGSVSRLPASPDLVPIIATGIRVRVRVTRRNRQTVNGWNTRVWSAHDSVDEKIVEFGYIVTVRALYFDLAADMVVAWQWVGPDDAEMTFAIGVHKRIVAWHWRTPAWNESQVGEVGTAVYFFLFHMSINSCTAPGHNSALVW